MRTFVAVLALSAGLAGFTGCQTHDNSHVEADHRVPGDYTYAYVATQETTWRSSTSGSAETGTVRSGTTIYTDRPLNKANDWQQARFSDGSVRLVDPDYFRATETTASVHD